MSGVVPACRSLDCVSIFARTCREAHAVWQAAQGFDAADPYSRQPQPGDGAAPWAEGPFRFGVPADDQLEFFGDDAAAELYLAAIRNLEKIGGQKVEIDFTPFRDAAELLYAGPWVAERYVAVGSFLESHPATADPVVRKIILGGKSHSAADAFTAEYRLRELRRATEGEWARMDVLVLPTAGTIYTHEQLAADPVRLNTNLGYYTNFVNLLDLAAVAAPAGFRPNGLPFGVSVIGPAFTDEALLAVAARLQGEEAIDHGARRALSAPGCVAVAVVGAHLSGQPLNWQLTELGGRLLQTCRTAPGYRLYELNSSVPPKPGLVRDADFAGPGIEVEVWAVPENRFGGFVAAVAAPLGIGSVTLESGAVVSCFLAEPYALAGAREITGYGGWRAFLAAAGE
jgi:allophanate hydrolase